MLQYIVCVKNRAMSCNGPVCFPQFNAAQTVELAQRNLFRNQLTICNYVRSFFSMILSIFLCDYVKVSFRNVMDRIKRIWHLSPMRAAKYQASLRIRTVSTEPSLLAHTSSESRGTFRQKARSLAPLNGWACAVKICHDGMLEDTNSLDGALMIYRSILYSK